MSIRVLIVDDSQLVRRVLREELVKDPEIQVVGTAVDPFDASEKIEELHPDVMTLDLELPRMDGLTFLRSLMRHHPMPVIIVSGYTPRGSRLALEALESGAVEIVPKPGMGVNVGEMASELIAKVKAASSARLQEAGREVPPRPSLFRRALTSLRQESEGRPERAPAPEARRTAEASRPGAAPAVRLRTATPPPQVLPPLEVAVDPGLVIVLGSSTGGTQALQYILSRLPANMPPILVVQHMPEGFTKAFAERLNTLSQLEIKEAEHHDAVVPGRALIAPGNHHMVLRRTGQRYWVEVSDGPRVCRQRPSVEVLFQSVAKMAGGNAIGAILTGMGSDGAEGMLAMNKEGAITIAEDEKSCVVFGMPKEAIKLGGVDHVVHLHAIPEFLIRLLKSRAAK